MQKNLGSYAILFVLASKLDIRKSNSIDNVLKKIKNKYGRIDVLVNNAGIVFDQFNHDIYNKKILEKVLSINLIAAFDLTTKVCKIMSKNKHFSDISVKVVKDEENFFSLKAEPFERGYAVTVGNALRRTLMTSVPGAAIVSVKVEGADHEFSVLEGVLEDVSDIILNLKGVIFRIINDGPEQISLSLKGPWEFKAKHIQDLISEFEVLNPDHLIATLNDKAKLNIDIRISRGKGYYGSNRNKRSDDVIGTIPMDSIFNPIGFSIKRGFLYFNNTFVIL